MLNRPPPYFPQNQLSPADDKRYRNFKLIVGGLVILAVVLVTAIGFGIYYLVSWLF
ncbi:MAG: hypothetical protein H0X08_06575 [Blastocatellia bacterium]|nr:hypothetical protein [Blastocatellia bacterium]